MKLELEVNSDEFDALLVSCLQETYIDHVKHWKHEPDFIKISESLLTVVDHFMVHSEFEEWYETIKEL